jgi:hypothetical protein
MAISMMDLNWAAGFLEGEGTFSAVPSGKRKDGTFRPTFNAMTHAGQVNLEPLLRLQGIFGGRIYKHNMHTGNPCWRWQVAGNKGVAIMMTIGTLMSARRREQIEEAIARWKNNRSRSGAAKARWSQVKGA